MSLSDPFITEIEEDLGIDDDSLKEISTDPPEILTPEQSSAFEEITSRFNGGAEKTSLTGQAGVGKTFLAARIAEAASEAGLDVHLCAPTHMACSSFQKAMEEETGSSVKVEVLTVQSLLGLVLQRDGRGSYELVKDGDAAVTPGGLVIGDEASQMGRDLWPHIQSSIDVFDLQWLFLGDWGQLPPVNEKPSPALKQEGPHLENIVRQKEGSPIITLASNVRSENRMEPTDENDGDEGIFRVGKEEFLKRAVESFEDSDPSDSRILAYRNRTVDEWGRKVREELFPDSDGYEEGMWIITTDSFQPPGSPFQVLTTSELLKVREKEETGISLNGDGFRAWELTAYSHRDEIEKTFKVPRDEGYYRQAIKDRKEVCKKGGEDWSYFYDLKESLADVRLAYSTTTHRAQGMTLEEVYLDINDLDTAPNKSDVQPLRYVAVTRAAERLYVLEDEPTGQISNEYVPARP